MYKRQGTFRGWDARLPADVELLAIQYPGRQERQDEPFVTDVEAMLCAIDDALLPLLDRPFALVGASLGGMLAYELAARLESLHGLRARQLFVISSRAPGPDLEYPRFHAMGDAELLRTLREYDVLPLEVLDDPELREISLATLRADSRLAEMCIRDRSTSTARRRPPPRAARPWPTSAGSAPGYPRRSGSASSAMGCATCATTGRRST